MEPVKVILDKVPDDLLGLVTKSDDKVFAHWASGRPL
jgi:hypothetical protein